MKKKRAGTMGVVGIKERRVKGEIERETRRRGKRTKGVWESKEKPFPLDVVRARRATSAIARRETAAEDGHSEPLRGQSFLLTFVSR